MSKKDDKAPVVETTATAPAAKDEKAPKAAAPAPAAKQAVVKKNVKSGGKLYKKGDVVTDEKTIKHLAEHGFLE